jgi:hypothetical protein
MASECSQSSTSSAILTPTVSDYEEADQSTTPEQLYQSGDGKFQDDIILGHELLKKEVYVAEPESECLSSGPSKASSRLEVSFDELGE